MTGDDGLGQRFPGDVITLKELYFHSVVVAPQSMTQFKFFEDVTLTSGTDRYILLAEEQDSAIFHVTGTLTLLNVTPAKAVQHRRPNSKVDEYTVRVCIEDEKHSIVLKNGFQALLKLLKGTPRACENISVSSGLVEKRALFKMEEVTLKISNYSNNVFYFNRKVATKGNVPVDDGQTSDFLLRFPQQGTDYPHLQYPTGWNLNPLIPVTDTEALDLTPEDITLPRLATVYFEIRQGCYNFEGSDGPIKQIVLIPTIIAVKVHPVTSKKMSVVQKAKRRRISC